MKKEMSRKKIIAISSVAAVIVLLLIFSGVTMVFGKKDKSYRSVKIVEIEGGVTVEREGTGSLNASVNMNLVSGDYLSTSKDAYVVLRLDTDKYVMLGESGAMKVIAQGSESGGKTSIQLDSGSVLSEIQNPLGNDSTFDIVTPNATMSVRGTVFEVSKGQNNGEETISVMVYDGKVAVGAPGEEQRLYSAGEFTEFTAGSPLKFITEKGTITEKQINKQVKQRLLKIQEQGRTLNIDGGLTVSGTNVSPSESETKPAPTQPAQQETKPVVQEEVHKPAPEEPVRQENDNTVSEETLPAHITEAQQETTSATVQPTLPNIPVTSEAYTPASDDYDEPDDADEPDDNGSEEETTSPAMPDRPEETTAPTTPGKPENPTEPTAPSKPENPTEPNKPENPTAPSKPENPTEPTNPTAPSKPENPTEPTNPDSQKFKVIWYRTYIALWSEENGKVYSYIKNISPYIYTEIEAAKGTLLTNPGELTVNMTPEGYVAEKASLSFVGWCTKDGKDWNYEKDTVVSDMALYPVWKDEQGRKYYPVFYSDETGDYPCNNIIENSEPKGEK